MASSIILKSLECRKSNEAEDEIRLTHDDNKVLLDYFFFSQGQVIVFEDQFNKNWPFDEKRHVLACEKRMKKAETTL